MPNDTGTKRATTSVEVAREAGVSQTTVSRVLNGRTDISIPDATRQRVFDAAKRLRYRVNRHAATMRSRSFNTFGLLLSTSLHKSMVPMPLLQGIQDELSEHGTHLVVSQHTDEEFADKEFMPLMLRESMLDGVLVNYHYGVPNSLLEIIDEHVIPAVFVNNDMPFNSVRPDDFRAGYEGAKLLIERGHRRIVYVGQSRHGHYSTTHRAEGYEAAMAEAGLTFKSVYIPFQAVSPVKELILADHAPTAVIADTGYAQLIYTVAVVAGLNVPADVSILAIEQVNGLYGFPQAMSNIQVPSHDVGSMAATMLRARILEPRTSIPTKLVEFAFDEGETVGSPRLNSR